MFGKYRNTLGKASNRQKGETMKHCFVVVAAGCMLASSTAVADTTPIMLSFGDPVQVPSA